MPADGESSVCVCGRDEVCITVFMSTTQGWTELMYALQDAEYNALASIFSVSIIVVIAFLGIQMFTSALCQSSMQVRCAAGRDQQCVSFVAVVGSSCTVCGAGHADLARKLQVQPV